MNNTLVYLQNDIENRGVLPFFIIGAFHLFRIVDSLRWLIFIPPKIEWRIYRSEFLWKKIFCYTQARYVRSLGVEVYESNKRVATELFIRTPLILVAFLLLWML